MTTTALLLALTAALVHAVWNVLLARARDPQAATAVALLTAEVVFAVPAYLAWHMDSAVWPYIVASGALQLVYFALLVTAYRLLPLSVVYPVSRGVAPVLVLVIGIVVLGHATSVGQVLGVCLVGAGILLVRGLRPTAEGRGGLRARDRVCDRDVHAGRQARRHPRRRALLSRDLDARAGAPLRLLCRRHEGAAARCAPRSPPRPSSPAFATFGAYCLVLLALQRAAAAPVAAVRETSVVVTALLAGRFLAEPVGRTRVAGAVVVACGIALVSLT